MGKVGQDLEATAAWLNERGYVINNCFQVVGGWRVNARRRDWQTVQQGQSHHFVEAATLPGALSLLVEKRMTAESRLIDALCDLATAIRGSDAL